MRPVPVFYECQRCTACCRWPGIVRITEGEIARLAAFKQMTEFDFIQHYTRVADDRQGLVLKDNSRKECIFLEGEDCAVQLAKPKQCCDFPNLWNYPGFEKICKAIPRMLSDEDYKRAIDQSSASQSHADSQPGNLPLEARQNTVSSQQSTDPTFKAVSNS